MTFIVWTVFVDSLHCVCNKKWSHKQWSVKLPQYFNYKLRHTCTQPTSCQTEFYDVNDSVDSLHCTLYWNEKTVENHWSL